MDYFDRFFADSALSGVLQRNWAGVEAFRLKATTEARKLFDELLKKHVRLSSHRLSARVTHTHTHLQRPALPDTQINDVTLPRIATHSR